MSPPPGLLLMLRLRERLNWAVVVLEARWSTVPGPVRGMLRRMARLGPLRRWLGRG